MKGKPHVLSLGHPRKDVVIREKENKRRNEIVGFKPGIMSLVRDILSLR